MNPQTLDELLLATKTNDFSLAATMMPEKTSRLGKLFAKTLGMSSGKMILAYQTMLNRLSVGCTAEETTAAVKNAVHTASKVNIRLPFSHQKTARLCGLVALNQAGFFDAETALYAAIRQDLGSQGSIDDIKAVARAHPETYGRLLEQKQNAIYDFTVLMGMRDDKARFSSLTEAMPTKTRKYFTAVSKLHKGGLLRPTWPLPFKKFSTAIEQGLYYDTIGAAAQEGTGIDIGFTYPRGEELLAKIVTDYNTAVQQPKKRWIAHPALTAAGLYLAGMSVCLAKTGAQAGIVIHNPAAVATSAGALLSTTLDNEEISTPVSLVVYSLLTTA
ncbi:MAG: hypothetical protein V1725_00265 [archaeon]